MRDDPLTAANRDKEQKKVTIPPRLKPTAETASPPPKPAVSGPFWTGKKVHLGKADDRRCWPDGSVPPDSVSPLPAPSLDFT